MQCKYFGECGSCVLYEGGYEWQLSQKEQLQKERFAHLYSDKFDIFRSYEQHYRARSEFRIWHKEDEIFYAMNKQKAKHEVVLIEECPQVAMPIASLMPKLIEAIKELDLGFKLFGIDFLSSSTNEVVASLLYHRKLDDDWQEKAQQLSQKLNISIIGRARKQKIVIGQDFVIESLKVFDKEYHFKHIENSFTQPNTHVNQQMIEWALKNVANDGGDLLELYCGAGNFTIPFASKFDKVLATEISKSSINAAKENMKLNNVENIEFVRMSVEEFVEALEGVREFNRMKHISLEEYNLQTVFVDPPRAGLDDSSREFISRYKNILYISCNPETLLRDLEFLTKNYKIEKMALFDQFPYTNHLEMGVKLTKK